MRSLGDLAEGEQGIALVTVLMIMVVLSGTWNNVRSMITGRYLIGREPIGGAHG